jgi:hypothetical protein
MTARVPRLPFALDPLMAEAKRRARQRRFLIVVVVLALIGGAAGAAAVFRSPGGPQSSLPAALGGGSAQARGTVLAQFPRLGISFRYPAGWRRVDCSPAITNFGSRGVTYLTTARRAGCSPSASRWTSANGVAVLWQQAGVVVRHGGNARIGGQPAQVYLQGLHAPSGVALYGPAPCAESGGNRLVEAQIHEPATANYGFEMFACLRGPKLRRSEAAVGQMLASVRFYPRPMH